MSIGVGESGPGTRPERQTTTPFIDLFFQELYLGTAEDPLENIYMHDVDVELGIDHEESTVHGPHSTSSLICSTGPQRQPSQNEDFIVACSESIKTFSRATYIEGCQISALEAKVILMLLHQTEGLFESLKYHWQNYKIGESTVPLSFFNDETGLFSEIESQCNGVWHVPAHCLQEPNS